jgi:hypothetical protein
MPQRRHRMTDRKWSVEIAKQEKAQRKADRRKARRKAGSIVSSVMTILPLS